MTSGWWLILVVVYQMTSCHAQHTSWSLCMMHKREGANYNGAVFGFQAYSEVECVYQCLQWYPDCVAVDYRHSDHSCYGHSNRTGDLWQDNPCCNRYMVICEQCQGDTGSDCSTANASSCYERQYRQQCCATCSTLHTGVTGCEFGDRQLENCSSESDQCDESSYSHTCCETCHTYQTLPNVTVVDVDQSGGVTSPDTSGNGGTTAPPAYGCASSGQPDPDWCHDLPAYECYDTVGANVCCQTCAGFKIQNAHPGCEYGDRADAGWCSEVNCHEQYEAMLCCQTCAAASVKN